jgi:hypothetical protein
MRKRILTTFFKTVNRSSKGIVLTEVLIAIVALSFIVASVPAVLVLIINSQYQWSEQKVAESLSRNQMEYIKVATYIPGNCTHPLPAYTEVPTPYESYDIDITAQPISLASKSPLPEGEDEGMQAIRIDIYHVEKLVLQTTNYKIDRLSVLAH